MSDKQEQGKEKFQQQIVFEDQDLNIAPEEQKTFEQKNAEQQVIFDNDNWLAGEENLAAELESEHETGSKKTSWLVRIFTSLFLILVTIEAGDFFINGFINSPVITGIYALIFSCLLLLAGSGVIREIKSLRQFKRQQKRQDKAGIILNSKVEEHLSQGKSAVNSKFDSHKFCQQITEQLPGDLQTPLEQEWADVLGQGYNDAELLALYSRQVLTKVDEKALKEIAKFSGEATVLVALSPVAIIDMALLFWRNLRMIDKIAALYGLKMGYWSRIKLIRQVFVNMVYAGASELMADFGTQMLGAELLGKLSTRFAQGLGAGMLTARLGIKTMHACRPLPFNENPPKLTAVRKEIQAQLKALLQR